MFEYTLKPKQMHYNSPNLIKWSFFNFHNFCRIHLVCTNILDTIWHTWALMGTHGHLRALTFSISTPRVPVSAQSARECPRVPMTQKSTDYTKLRSHIMCEYILKPKQMHPNSLNLILWSCFNFDNFYRRLLVCTNILDTIWHTWALMGTHGHSRALWALTGTLCRALTGTLGRALTVTLGIEILKLSACKCPRVPMSAH